MWKIKMSYDSKAGTTPGQVSAGFHYHKTQEWMISLISTPRTRKGKLISAGFIVKRTSFQLSFWCEQCSYFWMFLIVIEHVGHFLLWGKTTNVSTWLCLLQGIEAIFCYYNVLQLDIRLLVCRWIFATGVLHCFYIEVNVVIVVWGQQLTVVVFCCLCFDGALQNHILFAKGKDGPCQQFIWRATKMMK